MLKLYFLASQMRQANLIQTAIVTITRLGFVLASFLIFASRLAIAMYTIRRRPVRLG